MAESEQDSRMMECDRLVGGERFYVEREGDRVYLRHPVWSLVGSGPTIVDAENDLRADARDLLSVLDRIDPENVTPGAMRLRECLLRITKP